MIPDRRSVYGLVALLALLSAGPASAQVESRKPSIAVLPFRATDLRQHEGGAIHLNEQEVSLLTSRVITALVQTRKFTVVEREKIDDMIKEMDLTSTGIADPTHGVQLGRAIGSEYLLTGGITSVQGKVTYSRIPYTERYSKKTSGHISVQIRLIQTETTAIVAVRDESFSIESKEPLSNGPPRQDEPVPQELLEELRRGIVSKLVGTVVDAFYPLKVVLSKDGVVYLNRGEGGRLAAGDVLGVFLAGEALVDPDTGEILGTSETEIAKIEVFEIGADSTKARVLRWLSEERHIPQGAICRVDPSPSAKSP